MKFSAFLLLAAFSWAQSAAPLAQHPISADQSGAVLTKPFPPNYPPLARQARISGDVTVSIHVRPDGTVASAEALSGHLMLRPAAVDNAMKQGFECRECTAESEYLLTYSFGFIEDLTAYNKFEDRPVRAAKCMYLWKCGLVRVNAFDGCAPHPPEITRSLGHVRILAFPACVETMDSVSASR